MTENPPKPSALRITAAVILGVFVGLFIFFGIALVIGIFNDTMGTNIPVSTQFTENPDKRCPPGCYHPHVCGLFLLESVDQSPDNSRI